MLSKNLFPALIALFVGLSACAPSRPTPTAMMAIPQTGGAAMMTQPTRAMMATSPMGTPAAGMMAPSQPSGGQMLTSPAWLSASLTDVAGGESFSIAGFKGKVVLVENMAIWCTTCLAQEKEIIALRQSLGTKSDLVTVGLDIDPNENAADLKAYREAKGFDWTFAVAPREAAAEMGKLNGDQFLNPPSAPILLVDRKGQVHPLPFGVKSASDLKNFIEPYLAQGS
jgi:thiol-disulfide isomerase/thioredoxin